MDIPLPSSMDPNNQSLLTCSALAPVKWILAINPAKGDAAWHSAVIQILVCSGLKTVSTT